jgi:SAM-dependent methyltransferase
MPTLEELRRILLPLRDVLEGRVEDDAPPAWCERRGWTGFLLGLDDAEVARCEAEGPAGRLRSIAGAPGDLAAIAAEADAAARLPRLEVDARALDAPAARAVAARKRLQLPALIAAVGPMAEHAARIVDVGAGSGHFTRIAAETFGREAVGIERDPGRVARAEDRAREGSTGRGAARFVAVDACREPLALAPDDLAVGLHACGELGDRLAVAAAEAGCDLALVSCCFQKIEGSVRAPLSRAGEGLSFARGMLGLANLTASPEGVEASLDAQIAAREARYALRRLLAARGAGVAPGEEMRGINRRRARAGLAEIAGRALALRGLAAAADEEIARHAEEARRRYAAIRRLSLPRSMLARIVEIAVVLDRAAALSEAGLAVTAATIFERAASPRNVAIFASRDPGRLPRIGA